MRVTTPPYPCPDGSNPCGKFGYCAHCPHDGKAKRGKKTMTGSDLYQRQIAECDDDLMHKVWDRTPWMIDAYTGGMARNDERYREIMEWCRDQFGPEAWPIHGKPGEWRCGGATVHGWTWLGFATKQMMEKFAAAWPVPDEVVKL